MKVNPELLPPLTVHGEPRVSIPQGEMVREMVRYLEDNVVSNRAYGFRQEKSCVMNLPSFYTQVNEGIKNRDDRVDAVYLDIKKACNRIPHKGLLRKLKHIGGLRGKVLEWMQDHLKNREMRTVIREVTLSWRNVTSGVPQRSVLAPIMLLIYVNDMQCGVTSYMILFADDTKLMRIVKTTNDCQEL